MKDKKSNYPANFSFLEDFKITDQQKFETNCDTLQTKKHIVRRMNYKSTYIHGKS